MKSKYLNKSLYILIISCLSPIYIFPQQLMLNYNISKDTNIINNSQFLEKKIDSITWPFSFPYNINTQEYIFKEPLVFEKCKFLYKIDFRNITCRNEALFNTDTFEHHLNFINARFNYSCHFEETLFHNIKSDNLNCSKKIQMQGCGFRSAYEMYNSTFNFISHIACNFNNVWFQHNHAKNLSFNMSTFHRVTYFESINAESSFFNNNTFDDSVMIQFSKFDKFYSFLSNYSNGMFLTNDTLLSVDLLNCKISKYFLLAYASLTEKSNINLFNTKLPDTISFYSNPIIYNDLDLTVADYDRPERVIKGNYLRHNIFFYKTDISKIKLDYRYFKLTFIDPFTKHEITGDNKIAVYESLLKNFKDRGLMESYQLLDIEYQEFKWTKSDFPFMAFVNRIWWNYGYNKSYVFLWTLLLLIFFTLINFFALRDLNQEVYKLENLEVPSKKNIKFRLWCSFIYTSVIFFKLTLKLEKLNFNKVWGTLYLITVYIIGLICLAYIANFIIQK